MSKFGDMIRKAREEMESGVRKSPSLNTIAKLCEFLKGIDVEDGFKAVLEDNILYGMDDKKVEEEILFSETPEESDDELNLEDLDPKEVLGIYSTSYILGVPPTILGLWIKTGDMPVTMSKESDGFKCYRITDDNLKEFVKRHPMYLSRAIKAGVYDDEMEEPEDGVLSESDIKENIEGLSFLIWPKERTEAIMLNGDHYSFTPDGTQLRIFDKNGWAKAVFLMANIVGFQVRDEGED